MVRKEEVISINQWNFSSPKERKIKLWEQNPSITARFREYALLFLLLNRVPCKKKKKNHHLKRKRGRKLEFKINFLYVL